MARKHPPFVTSQTSYAALNTFEARNRNLAAVLEAVRESPGCSRSEICAFMPFTLQSMTNISQELIELGLIEEFDRPTSGKRGSPGRGLRVVADRAHAVGVQIRWDSCEIAVVDLGLGTRFRRTVGIDAAIDDAEAYVRGLIDAIGAVLEEHATLDIWSIGLSGPLPITVPNLPHPNLYLAQLWDDQRWFRRFWAAITVAEVQDRVARAFGLPVKVLNNPQSGAISEALRLPVEARFIYLLIGLGFGAAMVSKRQISRDVWRHSGEIGHVVIRGRTLSSLLSATGVRMHLGLEQPQGRYEEQLESILDNDPERFDPWLQEASDLLRFIVNFLENAMWPDGIALGGFLPERLLSRLIERLNPIDLSVVLPQSAPERLLPRLFKAQPTAESIPHGAAAATLSYRASPDLADLLGSRRLRPGAA